MKKFFFSAALMLLCSSAWAQTDETKQEMQGEGNEAVAAMRMASDLVKYGYAKQSALPLIDALNILNQNPTKALQYEREGDAADTSNRDGKSGVPSFDFDKILADAKTFAEGNEHLESLVAMVEADHANNHRGASAGAQEAHEVVRAHSTDTYRIRFTGNRLAEVAVLGDGDTDLDLYVYDNNWNLITSDTDYTDACYVRWTPAWTGTFIIRVVNRGSVYNRYRLVTN